MFFGGGKLVTYLSGGGNFTRTNFGFNFGLNYKVNGVNFDVVVFEGSSDES